MIFKVLENLFGFVDEKVIRFRFKCGRNPTIKLVAVVKITSPDWPHRWGNTEWDST